MTGNPDIDWYVRNRILDLETKVADLERWLQEATGKEHEQDSRNEESA